MTNDPDLDDCAFLSGKAGNERLSNELAMQILFQLFNRIYPALPPPSSLFCSLCQLQQLITFTVFPFTFLSGGESSGGRQTRTGVAVCSQRRALLVAGIVLGSLLLTAIIIAYAGPQNGRLCIVQIYLLFGCVSVCFLCYSFSLSFPFFSVSTTTRTTTRALACFVYMHYTFKCTDSSDSVYMCFGYSCAVSEMGKDTPGIVYVY